MATIIEAPPAIHDQRQEGLRRANAVRSARAQVKREFRAGERTLAQTLADPPDCILGVTVAELLSYPVLWGPYRSERLLRRVSGVSAFTRVVDLTGPQWSALRYAVTVAEEARR